MERKEIEEICKRHKKVFCRRCDYCQPCTEEIPIQLVLGMRSSVKGMGKSFLLKGWPLEAIQKARNCSECEECVTRCPYQLPIPDIIKENLQWWD
jgi:predicted aldo/keto reductase-like oxidoreductase